MCYLTKKKINSGIQPCRQLNLCNMFGSHRVAGHLQSPGHFWYRKYRYGTHVAIPRLRKCMRTCIFSKTTCRKLQQLVVLVRITSLVGTSLCVLGFQTRIPYTVGKSANPSTVVTSTFSKTIYQYTPVGSFNWKTVSNRPSPNNGQRSSRVGSFDSWSDRLLKVSDSIG